MKKLLSIAASLAALTLGAPSGAFANSEAEAASIYVPIIKKVQGTGRLQSPVAALRLDPRDPTNVIGAALSSGSLHRENHQVTFNGSFSGLQPNGAYTAWWFIFNRPEECTETPCSADDFFIRGIGQGFNAGGFLTNNEGRGDFSAHLPKGRIPLGADRFSDISVPVFGFPVDTRTENGLRRTFRSEIRLIVRYHGEPNFEDIHEQLGNYLGGCGPNGQGCYDDQMIIFLPHDKSQPEGGGSAE